jgi:hypothetical protein
MTTLSRVTCLIGLAAALVVSASGCDPYTYYNVDVRLSEADPVTGNGVKVPSTLNQIASCDVSVYASDDSSGPIESGIALNQRTLGPHASPCRGDKTPHPDLGILDYSSARSSGSLTFKVNLYDGNRNIIVQGSTDPTALNPGHVLPTVTLVASPCGPAPTTDQPNQQPCK